MGQAGIASCPCDLLTAAGRIVVALVTLCESYAPAFNGPLKAELPLSAFRVERPEMVEVQFAAVMNSQQDYLAATAQLYP
jgi:hypothetical protein